MNVILIGGFLVPADLVGVPEEMSVEPTTTLNDQVYEALRVESHKVPRTHRYAARSAASVAQQMGLSEHEVLVIFRQLALVGKVEHVVSKITGKVSTTVVRRIAPPLGMEGIRGRDQI
jgi:hypothetical protein